MNYFAYPSMFGWLAVVAAFWIAGAWLKGGRMKALRRLGPSAVHRRTFRGVLAAPARPAEPAP